MRKLEWSKKYTTIAVYAFLTLAALVLLIFFLMNVGELGIALKNAYSATSSIFYGMVIAYLCNPIYKRFLKIFSFVEKRQERKKLRKGLSVTFAFLTLVLIIALFIALLVPQVISSFSDLEQNFRSYISSLQGWLENIIYKISSSGFGNMIDFAGFSTENVIQFIRNFLSNSANLFETVANYVISYAGTFVIEVKNVAIGVFISIYMLLAKDELAAQCKKFLNAFMKKRHYVKFIDFCRFSHQTFGGYITGVITDAFIIGILCFFVFMIFGIPYYPLISVIIAMTNVIPVFGPFIGAIPSAFIVFVADPAKAIWFILLIFILQQIDGNVIAPKILGNSTGLAPLWVIIAITIMGGFFGLLGMFIGVPVFAVIYTVIKKFVENKLAKKALPQETEYYYKRDVFDIETNQLSFEKEILKKDTDEKQEKKSWLHALKEKIFKK